MPANRSILAAMLLVSALAPAATTQPSIEFLDADAAKAAIVDDSADPYFDRLTDHEMRLKSGREIAGNTHEEKVAEMKRRAQAAVQTFSDEDKETLTAMIDDASSALQLYPRFYAQQWS